MSFPPHLPPPSSSIDAHRRWERLKIIIFAAGIGLLSGITGALIVISWIWPAFSGGEVWIAARPAKGERAAVNETVAIEFSDRLVSVYRRALPLGSNRTVALDRRDRVGDAAVVSSDGWVVLAVSSFDGGYTGWRAVASDGSVHTVSRALEDRRANLLFLKLTPADNERRTVEQFKVASFADGPGYFSDIFVFAQGKWFPTTFLSSRWADNSKGYLDSAGQLGLTTGTVFPTGAWAVTGQGRIIGLAPGDIMLPASYISRVLPSVLKGEKITYPSLGVEGWYGADRLIVNGHTTLDGFLVNKVMIKDSPLRPGDIILELNGQLITPEKVWYNRGQDKVRVKVLRGGKEIELETKIVEL